MYQPTLADLKLVAEGTFVKARLKGTASKRGHVGWLECRMHTSDAVIANHGPFTIYINDESRVRWSRCVIKPHDIEGESPHPQLELKSRRRYVSVAEWLKDEENLRDLAVSITDLEAGSPDQNDRGAIEDREDELRERFGLEPIHRRATPHFVGKAPLF